jgi:hypothetical protein
MSDQDHHALPKQPVSRRPDFVLLTKFAQVTVSDRVDVSGEWPWIASVVATTPRFTRRVTPLDIINSSLASLTNWRGKVARKRFLLLIHRTGNV